MSISINEIRILGNCGKAAEVRAFPNGGQVATLRVATNHEWKDKTTGERHKETEWHTVIVGGRLVNAAQYCQAGTEVYVVGRLRTRKWQAADGTDRYTTEIVAQSLQLGSSPARQSDGETNRAATPAGVTGAAVAPAGAPAAAAAPGAASRAPARAAAARPRRPAVARPTRPTTTVAVPAGADDPEVF